MEEKQDPSPFSKEQIEALQKMLWQIVLTAEKCGTISVAQKVKDVKPSVIKNVTKEKSVNNAHSPGSFADVGPFVEEILHKTSELLLSEVKISIKEDTIKQQGEHLGTAVSDNLRKHLVSYLKNHAMIFKNTAYTEGFHAGVQHQQRHF
ncbi:uncharacterized protein [Cicer arietinum]|uniref:uncharacterized protein isoform X6 n=1 Tax=Cicer arietinum TaxID=3827 RepID=UPI003CC56730